MPSILVVCHANVCRSPRAARELETLIGGGRSPAGVDIFSAGIGAASGESACVVASEGIPDLAGRPAAPVTPEAVRSATMIITMERSQRGAVAALVPGVQVKVFTLTEAADLAEAVVARGLHGLTLPQIVPQLHGLRGQLPVPKTRRGAPDHEDIPDAHGSSIRRHKKTVDRVVSDSRRLGQMLVRLSS